MTAAAPRTLVDLLDDRVARYGNREFLRCAGRSWGFADLRSAARGVAAGLQALGITKGDRVALMMSNQPEFLASWFGLATLGAIEVPINVAHKGEMLAYLLQQSESRALIVESGFLEQVAACAGELSLLEHVIVLGSPAPLAACNVMTFERLLAAGGTLAPAHIEPGDPLAIMYTSGTTGPSKGAVMPHAYALRTGRVIAAAGAYDENDCLYNALPLFHGNAQFLSTLPALLAGARMVLAPRFSASRFWEDMRSFDCTEFNYIGGIIPILLKAAPAATDTNHRLRVMIGAGAALDVAQRFEDRFGVKLVEGYGMTEIGVPITNRIDHRRLGTCGARNPDYELRLVADDGSDVPDGEPGELLVRPLHMGSMMLEYYRMPENTVVAWRDLWFHTGDYLRRDEAGYYRFVDRKKDALRRRGENISSYEVEREVNSHPAVLESAAVAVRSELGEDEVLIVVALRDGCTLDPAELLAHCAARMAAFMVPRYVRFVAALPKTTTERVQKFALRAQGLTPETYDRERGA